MIRQFLATAAAATLAVAAGQASAQQPAAPVSSAASAPALPGICTISVDRAAESSAAGRAAGESLKKIGVDTNNELNAEATKFRDARTKFETDARAYNARYNNLNEDQQKQLAASTQAEQQALQRTQQGLAQQEQQLNQLIQVRQAEVEQTQVNAMKVIFQAMNQPIQDVFKARGCSILLHENAIALASPAMDITTDVVGRLDTTLKPFAIQREVLTQAPAQGAAARPAAASGAAARPAAAPAAPARTPAPARKK